VVQPAGTPVLLGRGASSSHLSNQIDGEEEEVMLWAPARRLMHLHICNLLHAPNAELHRWTELSSTAAELEIQTSKLGVLGELGELGELGIRGGGGRGVVTEDLAVNQNR